MNRKRMRRRETPAVANPYEFVTFRPLTNKFSVTVPREGKAGFCIGTYPTLELAMQARDASIAERNGTGAHEQTSAQ